MEDKIELINSHSYHYDFVGYTDFKKVKANLEKHLPYYKFEKKRDRHTQEIFYDIPSKLLAEGGIVISKYIFDNKASLTIRKVSNVKTLNKRSQKYLFGWCDINDMPRDYAFKLATIVEKSFRTPFSVDMESLIKQTEAFMSIEIHSQEYELICGTGYRATMLNELSTYRDLKTGKKIEQAGMTFKFPVDERPEKQQILDEIDKHVKGLALHNESRFELGNKLLFSEPVEYEEDEYEEDDEED